MIDERTIRVLLAALNLRVADVAREMGISRKHVSNVFNGFAEPSQDFISDFGTTIGRLVFDVDGIALRARRSSKVAPFPSHPLRHAVNEYARREGIDATTGVVGWGVAGEVWIHRRLFDLDTVDRVCDGLHIHPTELYPDYYERAAS